MKKRLLAILLAQALAISGAAAPVYAADGTSSGLPGYEDVAGDELAGSEMSEELSDESLSDESLSDELLTEEALEEWTIDDITVDGEDVDDTTEEAVTDGEEEEVLTEEAESDDEELTDADEEEAEPFDVIDDADGSTETGDDTVEEAAKDDSVETAPGDEEEIQAITDELKKKKEETGAEADLTPLVEERLEAQEEILVGKPAASDVRTCDDTEVYAQALCDINIEYHGDYDGQIVLDVEAGTLSDDEGEKLVGADSTVLKAMEEENAEAAAAYLKDNGYSNVTCEGDVVKADDPYVTARLYVMSSEPVDTRGAISVITFGETNIVQYATPAEAAIALEMLKDDPGVWEVLPDYVMSADDMVVDKVEVTEEDIIKQTSSEEESEEEEPAEEAVESKDAGDVDSEADDEAGDEEEVIEEPVIEIEASGEEDDWLCEEDDEAAEFIRVEEDPEEASDAVDAESSGSEDIESVDLVDLGEDAETDEETVGRYFKDHSSYLSRAVSYMKINKLLNNTGYLNNSVKVAVIDTGYDTSCTCVSYNRVLKNKGVCLYGGGMHDVNGHGTFVLNQIYEATNNSVKLIPIGMYDDYGQSPLSMGEAAIYKAVDLGANVINYSNGCRTGYDAKYSAGEAALQYALNHKCYLVASAGNDETDARYYWPANSSKCLTISAISCSTRGLASYSNFGPAVDFAAPGGDGKYDEWILGYGKGNEYTGYSGTSQAAPYYTAIIANLKADGRSYSSLSKLISSLSNYCDSSLTSGSPYSYNVGHGCVNLSKAINRTITTNAFKNFGSRAYTGSAIKPNPTVKYNGTKLKKGRDYILGYSNNVNVGTARIYVKGRGVYHGTAYRNFKIVPRSIAKATVSIKKNAYAYTGNTIRPTVTVKLNGRTLKKGTDYTVTYSNNKGPGRAKIVVKGRRNYKGSKTVRFGIYKRIAKIVSGYSYILVPKGATGRAVALKNGGMTNNTSLFINTKSCSEAQQFKITRNSNGYYTLRSVKCGYVMDSYKGRTGSGVAGVIRNYGSSIQSQKWRIKRLSDGSFMFINKKSGKALSATNSAAKGAAVKLYSRSGSKAQRFYLERVSTKVVKHAKEGYFSVRSAVNTRFAIDIEAASKKSGAKVQIYRFNGTKAQKFRFIYSGDGTYRIANINSGKVLMPTGSKSKKGAAIVQGVWKGKKCQRWYLIKASDGYYILRNAAGYYLQLTGSTAKNSVKLKLGTLSSAKRTRWVRKAV